MVIMGCRHCPLVNRATIKRVFTCVYTQRKVGKEGDTYTILMFESWFQSTCSSYHGAATQINQSIYKSIYLSTYVSIYLLKREHHMQSIDYNKGRVVSSTCFDWLVLLKLTAKVGVCKVSIYIYLTIYLFIYILTPSRWSRQVPESILCI